MSEHLKFLAVVLAGFAGALLLVAIRLPQAPLSGVTPAQARAATEIPTPTPPPAPLTAIATVTNSDASHKLTMKSTRYRDRSDYAFYVARGDVSGAKLIFTQTLAGGDSMSLPRNSWSPDNQEVYLLRQSGSLTQYLVFQAGGENYNQGDKYLEITSLFAKANNRLRVRDVTGWDGYGLLHVETVKSDGSRGPNFWFVTGTQQFLQLAKAPNE